MECSVARTLSVIGDRWTLLVLRNSFLGCRRFEEFATLGISTHLLTSRLSKLVEHEILERQPYQERPVRYEYRLTEKGRDLYPVIVAMLRFGDRWLLDEKGPPVSLTHRGCGSHTTPNLTCSECGETVDARSMEAHLNF